MTGPAERQRYLVISNGHGEDAIAAQMIQRLPPTIAVEAYPVIGNGKAYDGICPVVGPRATLASEGWRNVKGSLRRDVVNGGLMTIPPALRFLRNVRGKYDRIVVVGDMVGVLACLATGHRGLIYLDVYKTGAARLYSRAECWAIRQTCSLVFCRAPALSEGLAKAGVDARCVGNVMMDTIPYGDYDAGARRQKQLAVTLLPGSRALTAESFAIQIAGLRGLPGVDRPDVFVAVAGSVKIDELAKAAGLNRTTMLSSEPDDLGTLTDGTLTVHLARGRAMGNLLAASDVVMSQAGTATVQSLGLGIPVITFINPRDRRSRFQDEQRLFGAARQVVGAEPTEVSTALDRLLTDMPERARLGSIGRQRIGGPGALDAVLGALGLAPDLVA